jgi:hypothetical protein
LYSMKESYIALEAKILWLGNILLNMRLYKPNWLNKIPCTNRFWLKTIVLGFFFVLWFWSKWYQNSILFELKLIDAISIMPL